MSNNLLFWIVMLIISFISLCICQAIVIMKPPKLTYGEFLIIDKIDDIVVNNKFKTRELTICGADFSTSCFKIGIGCDFNGKYFINIRDESINRESREIHGDELIPYVNKWLAMIYPEVYNEKQPAINADEFIRRAE